MKYTLANGKAYISGRFEKVNIVVEDGKILKIGNYLEGEIYDVADAIITPSFIDPHVHMREPGYEAKETIKTGSLAAAHGGYTTCFLMPNLKPAPATKEVLENICNIIKKDSKIELYQIGSITKDQTGLGDSLSDMEDIAPNVIGYSDDGNGVLVANTMYNAMERAKALNKPIISHCEDKSLVRGGVVATGEFGRKNNLPMIDPVSEACEAARNALLAYKTGCHLHICHVSSIDTIEIADFYRKKGANITIEVTPHQLTLTDEDIVDANFKMNPPLSTKTTQEYLLKALKEGKISCIATDHAPHTEEEKSKGLLKAPFGIVGLETSFPVLYTDLVKTGKLSLEMLLDNLSYNVSDIFDLPANAIVEGNDANMVVIDLNKEYTIDRDFFMSKGKNSPYIGKRVFASIEKTIYKGEIVYEAKKASI